jgi:uncharacterized protein (UPF0335 family)
MANPNANTHPAKGNGYDPKTVNSFAARLDGLDAELESERGKYMKRCHELRDDISDILDEAKDKGIPKKAFKAVRKAAKYERKATRAREDLEPDHQDSFDLIKQALGEFADTALGKATLSRATKENTTANAMTS